jgi:hypothetical protein
VALAAGPNDKEEEGFGFVSIISSIITDSVGSLNGAF